MEMERLSHTYLIPDTTRIVYRDLECELKYQKLFSLYQAMWESLEFHTVTHGLREAAIISVPSGEIDSFLKKIIKNELYCTPLGRTATSSSFSSQAKEPQPRESFSFRMAVHRNKEYFEDTPESAHLRLGYPKCCTEFFDYWWNQQGYFDLTWPMYNEYDNVFPQCNLLVKTVGIRPVFHMPCCFSCVHTIGVADKIYGLAVKLGYGEVFKETYVLLKEPFEWSALHGYAEIRHKDFKIVTKTDATGKEYKFQINEVSKVKSDPLTVYTSRNKSNDNGFLSDAFELLAHGELLRKAISVLSNHRHETLVDLGCGNGNLLKKIADIYPSMMLSGIEVDYDKYVKACANLEGTNIQVECKNIFQYGMISKSVILVAKQRFDENPHLRSRLQGAVLEYDYNTNEVKLWNSVTPEIVTSLV